MAEQKVYLRSVKAPMRKFEVLSFDKETSLMKLRTPSGVEFEYENMTKEKAKQYGYELVKE
jgi:hypothetical protein